MDDEIKINKQEETKESDADAKKSKKNVSGKINKKKPRTSIKDLTAKLESKEQEAKDSYDRFLRVSAEFENFKKRSAREISDFKKFANESLIKELLPVVDNLERALNSAGDNGNSEEIVFEGIQLTLKEILKVLEKFGVKPINALEQPFDPNFHQAVMQEDSPKCPEQTVLKELQKGYMIHDRLLRPSMVVVSK